MTSKQKAYVEYELSSLRQHLVVADDPDREAKLEAYRKELGDNPVVPSWFRMPRHG